MLWCALQETRVGQAVEPCGGQKSCQILALARVCGIAGLSMRVCGAAKLRAEAEVVAKRTEVSDLNAQIRSLIDSQQHLTHAIDEVGGGWLINESAFAADALAKRLDSLFGLRAVLQRSAANSWASGRPDAAIDLANLVSAIISISTGGNRATSRGGAA